MRHPYYGIHEIFGIQRKAGKTTLMTAFAIDKMMDLDIYTLKPLGHPGYWYKPEDVIVNYPIFIPGIKALNNEQWFNKVAEIKRLGLKHKLILGDELNSILLARNTKDMNQAQFAVYVWQMCKDDTNFFWTNNQLTGVDVIIRDGTWETIMPTFDEKNNKIHYAVIHNYGNPNIPPNRECFNDPFRVQELFDSYASVK